MPREFLQMVVADCRLVGITAQAIEDSALQDRPDETVIDSHRAEWATLRRKRPLSNRFGLGGAVNLWRNRAIIAIARESAVRHSERGRWHPAGRSE
jgi:hypothetical protein